MSKYKPVLQKFVNFLDERNIEYTVIDSVVRLKDFSVRCVEADNITEVTIQPGEKMISAENVDRDIERVASWMEKKPTLRIEKMNISIRHEGLFLYIEGFNKKTGELVVNSVFHPTNNFYCWAEVNYFTNFVPGWLSKCMSMLTDKPIHTYVVTEENAFVKLGFKRIGQCNVVEMWESIGANVDKRIRESIYDNPEKIKVWKLVYDNISTI